MSDDLIQSIMEGAGVDRQTAVSVAIMTGVVSFFLLSGSRKSPAWTKDLPPAFERRAGPWRGKGSFGSHFGSQAKHR